MFGIVGVDSARWLWRWLRCWITGRHQPLRVPEIGHDWSLCERCLTRLS